VLVEQRPAAQAAGFCCIERHHSVIGELGERFLFYRLETHEDDREAIADVALGDSWASAARTRSVGPHRWRMVRQEAVARLMHGWVLVLALVNLILADAIVWFVIAPGWP